MDWSVKSVDCGDNRAPLGNMEHLNCQLSVFIACFISLIVSWLRLSVGMLSWVLVVAHQNEADSSQIMVSRFGELLCLEKFGLRIGTFSWMWTRWWCVLTWIWTTYRETSLLGHISQFISCSLLGLCLYGHESFWLSVWVRFTLHYLRQAIHAFRKLAASWWRS